MRNSSSLHLHLDLHQRQTDPQTPAAVGPSVAAAPSDPLREAQAARKLFEARWNAAGLRKFSRLSHNLHGRLAALLLDPWWAANYPAALERAGRIPFLAAGAGRKNGPYDVAAFLASDDEARKIIDGVYDPRPVAPDATGPPAKRVKTMHEFLAEQTNP